MVLAEHGSDATSCDGFAAASTKGAALGMVMSLAVGHPFVVEEGPSIERLAAVPAHETLWVPLGVEGRDVVLHDGGVAARTLGGKHVVVVLAAVGLSVAFVEAFLAESIPALCAEEVLRVPRLVQGCYAFVQDGSVAVSTSRREQIVVVGLAVRPALTLEEVLGAQLLVAMRACEVFRVPGLA